MKGFTIAKIKIIYCYIMCIFCVLSILFRGTQATNDCLRLVFFDDFYSVGYNLQKGQFYKETRFKNSSEAEIEKIRQDHIADDKTSAIKKLKKDILLSLPHLIYSLIILLIHVFLIRTTKKSEYD